MEELAGDEELEQIARFAAHLCNAPSAAVSLVDNERQRFVARKGLEAESTRRSTSFCAHAMFGSELLEVLDATADPRFANFELVQGDEHVRYYVGAPLISSEGAPMGALCVIDSQPRTEPLNDLQREGLLVLAETVKRRLEAHRQHEASNRELSDTAGQLQFMLDSVPDIAWSATPGPAFERFNARFAEVTGKEPPRSVDDWRAIIHPEDYEASLIKFEQALKTAAEFEDEWRLRQADGSYRWVLSRAVPSNDDPATTRWFGTLTDIHDRYILSQERELLAGELAHRIKNIFSVISGLITLRSRKDAANEKFAEALNDNIRALARAQEYALPTSSDRGENLLELLGVIMAPYGADSSEVVTVTGEAIAFGKHTAMPLALIYHELATNSAKYGALSVPDGRIEIDVSSADKTCKITWRERGGPPVAPPLNPGFGSRLISMAISHQLGGEMRQEWHADGLEVVITILDERLSE